MEEEISMSKIGPPVTYRGRIFSVFILVVLQVFIGLIHGFFGIFLLTTGFSLVYSVYTLFYGVLTMFFAYGLWMARRWGWIGTVAVSGFVIIMDSATLLNAPIISEIPSFAAATEIIYSLAVTLYLIPTKIQHAFLKTKDSNYQTA